MEKFYLNAKAGQSQEKLDQRVDAIWNKYSKGTGSTGCQMELIVRHLMSAKGITTEVVQAAGKADLIVFLPNANGKMKRFVIEIKTGTGIVAEVPAMLEDSMTNHSPAEVYPKADLVVYAARATEFIDIDDVLDETLVLPTLEWVQFMIDNSGVRKHGFETAFKLGVNNKALRDKNDAVPARQVVDKKGNLVFNDDGSPKMTKRGLPRYTDCIVIQEAYQAQVAQAIIDNMETHEYETLGDWLERMGRA